MTLEITEDLIAKQSPEAQAIIRLLLDRLAELESRLGKSPQTPRCRRVRNIRMPNQNVPSEMVSRENEAGRKDISSITGN